MLHLEILVHDSVHQTTLAHPCVPNDNQLEQVVLLVHLSLVSNHLVGQLPQLLHFLILHLAC